MSRPIGDIEIAISSPTSGTSYPQGGTMSANGTFTIDSENTPTIQYQITSSLDNHPAWLPVTAVTMNPPPSTSGTWNLVDAALPKSGSTWTLAVQLILSGETSPSASTGASGPLTSSKR